MSEEVQLYQIDTGVEIGDRGLFLFTTSGTPRTIDGQPMVKTRWGIIVPAAGFHATLAEAQAEAATKIEALARRLLDQAASLRGAQNAAPSA